MYNAGQSCCGIERAYIHKDLYEEFIEKAKDLISKYKLGNPMNADVTMGPLALPESPIKLKEQVDEAVSSGATVVIGGNICNDEFGKGRFFEPTLIRDCSAEMTIMTEESFGPILPVASVEDDNEAISLMNNSDYGLSASIYSKDYHEAETLSAQLEVGTVFLNRCDYCHPLLAWAGRKKSGNGVSLSKYGFNNFYKTKSINFRLPN
jgi:acyl-CoA reductase-like NAD-dependent aldehyde dehydrogenase